LQSPDQPIFLQSLFLRLVGAEKFSDHGRSILDVSMRSGLRTRGNWLIPALAIIAASLLLFAFRFAASNGGDGFGTAFGRIFIFDYMIFVLSWVSGWNMSYRWRKNPDLIEEVALTDMRPRHLFLAQAGGILAVWFYFLIVFAVFELVTIAFVYVQSAVYPTRNLSEMMGDIAVGLLVALVFLPPVVMLAWFHFESVVLAHRMFALGALPRIPLGPLAATNFVSISLHVIFLSVVGCMITGGIFVFIGVAAVALDRFLRIFNDEMMLEVGWMYAALAGLLAVIFAKKRIGQIYQHGFDGKWIAFQWWGAAELDHPAVYPVEFLRASRVWGLYHNAQEAEETPALNANERNAARTKYVTARKALETTQAHRVATGKPVLGAPAPIHVQKGALGAPPLILPTPLQVRPAEDPSLPNHPPPSEHVDSSDPGPPQDAASASDSGGTGASSSNE